MTAEAIAAECDHFRNSNLKNSYVVKGHGNGLGTQFSHPRMDFLCLGKRVTDKLKRKCETRRKSDVSGSLPGVPYEYFSFDHFSKYGQNAMEELKQAKAVDAILANKFA